ncbi:MAG TPA: hypothetical protein VGO43_11320 [Pyrinomonadaceae bacterium]|jgi:hypothetical protein|nr:hypothetical protein [Pyrinomonadaceae bacterium]
MKKHLAALPMMVLVCAGISTYAQPKRPTPKPTPKPAIKTVSSAPRSIVFAVLNDGKTLEPIGYVSKGRLSATVNGSDPKPQITSFARTYYKAGTTYSLVSGGAKGGTVRVTSSNANAECAPNTANVTTKATGAPLKGLVMGVATNMTPKNAGSSRRKPTPAEKNEADVLAKDAFAKEKLTPKTLHYQNLTAIDVDNDGKAELVGSYWVEIDKLTRGLLFFIAGKGSSGKYSIGYKEYRSVDQANVMSGNISAVDEGVYHELLLDYVDIDGDGTAEIFSYQQGFEGAGFSAYKRSGGRWTKVHDFNNYHCGF